MRTVGVAKKSLPFFTGIMADLLTLDPQTARFFLPRDRSAPVQERFELDVPGLGTVPLRGRAAHDICGHRLYILQREGAHRGEACCFIANTPPHTGPIYRFWLGELQRAVFDAGSGAGVLVDARGRGAVAPLQPARTPAFYRFGSEKNGAKTAPCDFFSLSGAELGARIGGRLNERDGMLCRTWRFAEQDENARCRAVFGCSRENLDRAREVLRWALGREMALNMEGGVHCSERAASQNQGQGLRWLFWMADAACVHCGGAPRSSRCPRVCGGGETRGPGYTVAGGSNSRRETIFAARRERR